MRSQRHKWLHLGDAPAIWANLSIRDPADLLEKMKMAMAELMSAPAMGLILEEHVSIPALHRLRFEY